jgi:hypothetical protein
MPVDAVFSGHQNPLLLIPELERLNTQPNYTYIYFSGLTEILVPVYHLGPNRQC